MRRRQEGVMDYSMDASLCLPHRARNRVSLGKESVRGPVGLTVGVLDELVLVGKQRKSSLVDMKLASFRRTGGSAKQGPLQ